MVLGWNGLEATPQGLKKELYTPGRQGTLQPALKAAARRRGRLAYEISGLGALLREVAAGHPVIVLQNLGLDWFPKWHYAVAVGFDLGSREVFLHSGKREGLSRGFGVFQNTWERSGCWGLLVLDPGTLPATAERGAFLQAVLGLEQAGKYRAAARGYAAAMSRWPQSLTAAMGRGNCLYRLGELRAAEEAFRHAAEAHPEAPEPLNNLAQILMETGRNRQALEAARAAVELGGRHKAVFERTLREIRSRSRDRQRAPCQSDREQQ
jgi:tetratricopeptide (TPR) repeat protein